MKNKFVILTISVLLFFAACSNKYTKWQNDVETGGLSFTKLRYSVYNNDTLSIIGKLKTGSPKNTYPLKAGWVHFTKNWEPMLFCLDTDCNINSRRFKAGTWVSLHTGNEFFSVVFQKDTIIDGYKCKGGGGINGIQTSFYNSGQLRGFYTDRNITVDGFKCKCNLFHPIILDGEGKLKSCKLNERIFINDTLLRKGTILQINALEISNDHE